MVEHMNFTVTGEFITSHFRQLCLEKNFEGAISGLQESLIGIDLDTVISVLRGDKRFTGENDIFLEDEADSSYKDSLLELFYDHIFYEGSFYQVVGVINTIKKDQKYIYDRARLYVPYFDKIIFHNEILVVLKILKQQPPFFIQNLIKNNTHLDLDIINEYGVSVKDVKSGKSQQDILLDLLDQHVKNKTITYFQKNSILEDKDNDFFNEEVFHRTNLAISIADELEDNSIITMRSKVIEQADKSGYIVFESDSGVQYKVPKVPYLIWASKLGDISIDTSSLSWEPVSYSGFKMQNDSVYHTDFCLGTSTKDGFIDINSVYDDKDFKYCIYSGLDSILEGDFFTISGSGIIEGIVHFFKEVEDLSIYNDKIVVVPDASVKYFELAKHAKLVISKVGGPASHLAINAYEYNINLICMNSCYELSDSAVYQFYLDTDKCKIKEVTNEKG